MPFALWFGATATFLLCFEPLRSRPFFFAFERLRSRPCLLFFRWLLPLLLAELFLRLRLRLRLLLRRDFEEEEAELDDLSTDNFSTDFSLLIADA